MDNILQHRKAVQDNISKAFNNDINLEDYLEKAHYVGDLFFQNGKTYMWTEYAPGKFDWHVVKNNKVVNGKGFNGSHGIKGIKKAFESVNKQFTDVDKMLLKRTPNGYWRLMYDNQDTGLTIDGDTFTESELQNDNVCYESRKVVDNFELVKNYMQFNSPDDVYFVQIIKRWKDNKDKPNADNWKRQTVQQGTYHAGAEYLNYWLIHSPQDIDAIKNEVLKVCSYNNARAYISINPRSQKQVAAYMPKFLARHNPSDPQYKHAEAILYGEAKSGPAWKNERFRVLLDIDTTRDSKATLPNGKTVNIWDETRKRLNNSGVKIAGEYETPSGGLHLIINNKNNRNLPSFYKGLKDFDGGRNLGKMATVHPSEDIKMILYSNVDTAGY